MPADRKIRFEILSLSVTRPTRLGMMMNNVHQPSKKTLMLNRPSALPPKITPSAMMATPQMIDLSCFFIELLLRLLYTKI